MNEYKLTARDSIGAFQMIPRIKADKIDVSESGSAILFYIGKELVASVPIKDYIVELITE